MEGERLLEDIQQREIKMRTVRNRSAEKICCPAVSDTLRAKKKTEQEFSHRARERVSERREIHQHGGLHDTPTLAKGLRWKRVRIGIPCRRTGTPDQAPVENPDDQNTGNEDRHGVQNVLDRCPRSLGARRQSEQPCAQQ